MAVTHADLATSRKSTDIGSLVGVLHLVFSVLCGLCCFILCLFAEATRSEVTWLLVNSSNKEEQRYECVYSGSGKTPLTCAVAAFVALAIAMVTKHAYILIAVSKDNPPALVSWTTDSSSQALTWQACFFFAATWVCFAVAEVLLMIGIGVETGHLKKWTRPRPSCLVARQGLFAAAGIFGLTTVFLAAGLFLTALRAQQIRQDEDNVRLEVLNTSYLFASPPRSPRRRVPRNLPEVHRLRRETPGAAAHGRESPSSDKTVDAAASV
ncbi:hypothetical protein H6P81_004081 [Aristolochia fimbriata]|uniref:Transmembrane protein n=1 Tax=Aristolochia fimbriata TaxID=158543 RepID=A0AAV7FHR0_ARIFI|nr:hypothetical protein H6P81_004081 [Aristolochia fimbriata]